MYVCGPNLYGPVHVGHAFSYIFFDVARRYLEYLGHTVRHVQNFTDVEDRIIARAKEEGRTIFEIADEFVARFHSEMDALGVQRAYHYPRATEVMPKIIEIIEGLIAKEYAYVVPGGDVYFRVRSFPNYAMLSGRPLEEMQAGARVEVDPRKEDPLDFDLWKVAKPGEPSWPSPWGPGRPGWHIECSAMTLQYLGEQIDIHGGGADLIFPHHENEIAQSEAFTGKSPFARVWLHNALLKPADGDEKMTRHLTNFVTVQDALARFEPDAIRLFMLSAHYRTPLRWTNEAVAAAARGLERLRTALANAAGAIARAQDDAEAGLVEEAAGAKAAFEAAMNDDFSTPLALAALFTLAAEMNKVADAVQKGGRGRQGLRVATETLRTLAGVLGLSLKPRTFTMVAEPGKSTITGVDARLAPENVEAVQLHELLKDYRREHPQFFPDSTDVQNPEQIVETLLEGRRRARDQQAYTVADEIRARLASLGVVVEDLPEGTRWRAAAPSER